VHFWILVVFVLSLCLLMLKVLLPEELETRVFWLSLAHYRLQAYGCDSDFIMLFKQHHPFGMLSVLTTILWFHAYDKGVMPDATAPYSSFHLGCVGISESTAGRSQLQTSIRELGSGLDRFGNES